jgi:hypothetical protein
MVMSLIVILSVMLSATFGWLVYRTFKNTKGRERGSQAP